MSASLGKALRMLRKNCELTQQQVADVLNVDRTTYCCYETGTTEPSLKSIALLGKIFKIDPALLLPEKDGTMNIRLSDVTGLVREEIAPEDKEKFDPRDEKIFTLSKDEQSFLIWYRALNNEQKTAFEEYRKDNKPK